MNISRRDFLNGVLIASGGIVVGDSFPLRAFAKLSPDNIDLDPRALRGGNVPAAFTAGHWLRDGRLQFSKNKVTIARGNDSFRGSFSIEESSEKFDAVIVGSGLSGLSAAFFLLKKNPKARILMLDGNPFYGGNSGRDDLAPLPVMASTGGSYCVAPYNAVQKEIYGDIGLEWEKHKIPAPMYSYYFDDQTPGVKKNTRAWNIDTYGKGIKSLPYSEEIVKQLEKCREIFMAWAEKEGAPTDPPDASDPRYDSLAGMTLEAYLTKELKCDPLVADFFTRYTIDALGGTAAQVNAHSSIGFLGAEYGDLFAFPGGNSGLARSLVQHLIPSTRATASAGGLDHAGQALRIRQEAMAVRADAKGVVYFTKGKFHLARANSVILAGQSHTSQHLVDHLTSAAQKAAWKEIKQVPVVVANVAVNNSTPFVEKGFGYNQYWWGSKYWADFVIADWTTSDPLKKDRLHPNRPTVLTFFGGNTAPPEELPSERYKLLQTPFADYEKSLREDLSRIMAGSKFDFDRDVTSVFVYRWGHGMLLPTLSSVFQGTDRAKSPRRIACAKLGNISFAGQDTEGTPSVESALGSGHRAALETFTPAG